MLFNGITISPLFPDLALLSNSCISTLLLNSSKSLPTLYVVIFNKLDAKSLIDKIMPSSFNKISPSFKFLVAALNSFFLSDNSFS